jgi:acetylornithine deacetylase/succinyl-diaminopimelate desuccinylase-like protein
LEVNGLFSGYIGEGSKTVLPSFARAKISCRLVPDQHPDQVYEQMKQYMKENAPDSIRWEIIQMGGSPPSISDRNSPWVKAYSNAAESVWGVRTAFKREGGSVPVVTDFQQTLGVDVVNIGFGLPTDNMHGPNEKLDLHNWYRGIDALIHFFYNLAEDNDR